MKTHIFLAFVMTLLVTACASHEGRTISSTAQEEVSEQQTYFSRAEGSGAREAGSKQ